MTRLAIVYNQPLAAGHARYDSSADVLVQVEAVAASLVNLGHTPVRIPFTLDLAAFLKAVQRAQTELVFNLCESVDEDPQLGGHPAAVLELRGLPYTGSRPLALMLSTDKLLSKRVLMASGIDTPNCLVYDGTAPFAGQGLTFPVLVKPRFEDASIGIDQESVFVDPGRLSASIQDIYRQYGPLLVEEYIEGREFNIALLGFPRARVLPVAEIDFSAFPANLFHIVGYRAKWDDSSFEYHNSPRCFPSETRGDDAFACMRRIALQCFTLFGLRDYGRVDMRMAADGRIYVLEVNANPCLSPDAGFAAAARQQGISYDELVEKFLHFLQARPGQPEGTPSGQRG
ncbi:MAG: D-alanine--D-alanine ligase [Deltaproteobacteria bacterium CG23_combo_of_CG06-09_8_20_14_all_60_8]|nr:MAG: D-alanine--D-alanine ligase [Deltaproteobacteria bacterium CG23_combo_of_CG06-09_8_20_14_all_60_8]